ncbi:MAG TPA: (d)CMP kinase [Acidimicrobiia bacterium]|nr:(d)CMP kinase [Acidimicrobiia bacterium]
MVVAIDGPSGVGKSTVSRAVAAALGIPYLDTGAYYRLATLVTLRAGGDPADAGDVLDALHGIEIDFQEGRLLLNGADVSLDLRSPAVTAAVSVVAAHARVRRAVVELQRLWVARHGGEAVVEGRDIGTVVFPDAPVKVFLTADPDVRARRRAADPEAEGHTVEGILEQIARRDEADTSRAASPLRAADDAVTIDTSDLTIADVVGRILDLVETV